VRVKRDRLIDLNKWRFDSQRKPLIMRGCRQVGKSWLISEFGKTFENFISINFEKERGIHQYFQADLKIENIIEKLSLYSNKKIEANKTLIFFDEIQACEGALASLRYFKEEAPDLHVVAAGSLLDFALNKIGIPVGRVQFMHLYPLSFGEFLTATDKEGLREFLYQQTADPLVHLQLMSELKTYFWLGGMPAIIKAWQQEKDALTCQHLQDEIIETYQIDFHKYAKQHEIAHVTKVFDSIPACLGKKFIYSNIDNQTRGENIKNALTLLINAGIALPCYHTSAQQQPLGAGKDDKRFKIFFFDTGIAQRLLGLDLREWILKPLTFSNKGYITEQFVAQEFVAYSDFRKRAALYYWHREAKSSNAEVDFIVLKKELVVPVEVKATTKGSMKSMQSYFDSHLDCKGGLKISEANFSHQKHLQEIPLYGIEGWLAL